MMLHSLGAKERALSLWAQDRLDERPAIEWATKARKECVDRSAELAACLGFSRTGPEEQPARRRLQEGMAAVSCSRTRERRLR